LPGEATERPASIVGAGPAGEAVSAVLAGAGVAHDVYDEAPRSGGNLDRRRFHAPLSALERRDGPARFIAGASVLTVTDERIIEFTKGDGIERQAYRAVFLCTGAYDLQLPTRGRCESWSSAGALQALLKGQGIVPQGRIVLAGAGPFLTIVGADLLRAGARVTDIVDAVDFHRYGSLLPASIWQPRALAQFLRDLAALRLAGTRLHFGAAIADADSRSLRLGDGRVLAFDRLGVSDAFAPQTQLARSAGCSQAFSRRGHYFYTVSDPMGRSDRQGIYVCGEGQGVRGGEHARVSGALAALAWLADEGRLRRFGETLEGIIERRARPIPQDAWVCACERIPAAAVRDAIAAGLADLSSIKSVTRCGMGNCQGRYCEPLICRLFVEAGREPLSPLTQKGLVRPVRAGDLAGA
jgi:NADPH-dependent 2,4-dienoyl-CoA reductase/sulfur reductase-like enzyme/bacterioferritin-associated ferredoxin